MSSYKSKTTPFQHQIEAEGALARRPTHPTSADVYAWLWEYGLGKSWIILKEFGKREFDEEIGSLLIIAPKGVYMNWINQEIPIHLSDDLLDRALIGTLDLVGGIEQRRRIEKLLFTRDRPRILVVNVEAFSVVERVREAVTLFLENCYDSAMIAVDEVTTIKTYGYYKRRGGISGSKRSAYIVEKLAPMARVRRIATGLVAPNSPLDVYMPYAFLDWRILGHQTYFGFKQRYCIQKQIDFTKGQGRASNIIVGFRHQDELYKKISLYSSRLRKKDCLDLPEKMYQFRDVDMTSEQQKIYTELKKEAISEFENTRVTAAMVMTRVMRLHQIACGYVVDDDKQIHFLKENRTKALVEMLEDHDGKAIIWAPFRPLIKKIAAELRRTFGERSVVEFWGDTKAKDREEAKLRMREDPETRLLVGNPSTAGRGNTIVTANLMIFYTNSWDLEHRTNAEDRIHRIGQTRSCLYVDFRVLDSCETKIIQRLRNKLDVASSIMGDDWREWLV